MEHQWNGRKTMEFRESFASEPRLFASAPRLYSRGDLEIGAPKSVKNQSEYWKPRFSGSRERRIWWESKSNRHINPQFTFFRNCHESLNGCSLPGEFSSAILDANAGHSIIWIQAQASTPKTETILAGLGMTSSQTSSHFVRKSWPTLNAGKKERAPRFSAGLMRTRTFTLWIQRWIKYDKIPVLLAEIARISVKRWARSRALTLAETADILYRLHRCESLLSCPSLLWAKKSQQQPWGRALQVAERVSGNGNAAFNGQSINKWISNGACHVHLEANETAIDIGQLNPESNESKLLSQLGSKFPSDPNRLMGHGWSWAASSHLRHWWTKYINFPSP